MKLFVSSVVRSLTKNKAEYFQIEFVDEQKATVPAVMFDRLPCEDEIQGKVCEVSLRPPNTPGHKPTVVALSVLDEDPSPYFKTTTIDVDKALAFFKKATRGQGDITTIVDEIAFGSLVEKFKVWPAASGMHHAFQGGLIEHTWAMARTAEFLMDNDPSYADIDRGVVFGGILLHDLAKIFEYDWTPPGPATRTEKGRLLGHINLIDEMVVRVCREKKINTTKGRVLNLRHVLLSHHGLKQWGSPVVPSTSEAVLVHQLDMIQSRGQMAKEAIDGMGTRQSVYCKGLDTEFVKISEK